tara:strand:- start:103 stop:699 length:597 start_codon:yes stop_codon:yes gene_type:complete
MQQYREQQAKLMERIKEIDDLNSRLNLSETQRNEMEAQKQELNKRVESLKGAVHALSAASIGAPAFSKQLNIAAGELHAEDWGDDNVKQVKSVLQFFGWCRVWIFLLVTLGTFLFLSMTNELVKTTSIGNVFNSQVLVFALVLYLANVGYDVVREMLPAEFQTYETDETRFWVIVLYVIYFSINQAYYTENFLGHGEN